MLKNYTAFIITNQIINIAMLGRKLGKLVFDSKSWADNYVLTRQARRDWYIHKPMLATVLGDTRTQYQLHKAADKLTTRI